MNSLSAILASLAVLMPMGMLDRGETGAAGEEVRAAPERERAPIGLQPQAESPIGMLERARSVPIQNQVRIEQRIILRITPPPRRVREELLADMPRNEDQVVIEEGEQERCIRMNDISGMQPAAGNRLLLFMRDREILSATLERSCAAADFYSGFYVERSKDGRMCSRREKIQSRTGTQCEVRRISHLVAQSD